MKVTLPEKDKPKYRDDRDGTVDYPVYRTERPEYRVIREKTRREAMRWMCGLFALALVAIVALAIAIGEVSPMLIGIAGGLAAGVVAVVRKTT